MAKLEKEVKLKKKWVPLEKKGATTIKGGSHWKKWVTLRKMGHTWKRQSDKKIGNSRQNGSPLIEWVKQEITLGKMSYTLRQYCRNGSRLKKWATTVKEGHT